MEWTKNIRETGLIEWICEHGIGHPDEDSAERIANIYKEWKDGSCSKEDAISAWRIHGCDGCCGRDDFPGKKKEKGIK